MTEIFFPDVSHYQAGLRIQPGTVALLAKATEGSTYIDPSYQDFRAQAAAVGAIFGAYHWINGTDPHAQAALCFRVVGKTPVMWDVEAAGATVAQTLAVTAAFRALGGIAHLAYLPRWWWQQHLGSPDLRPLSGAGLGLVSSSYPAAGYTPGGPGWAPYGGVSPVQWQYTDDQPYGGEGVDFNAFRGTAAQYRAVLYGIAQPEEDMPKLIRVVDSTPLSGSYWLCTGPHRYWLRTQADLVEACAFWSLDPNVHTVHTVTSAQLGAYGVDVQATGGGAPGPTAQQIATAVVDLEHDRLAS